MTVKPISGILGGVLSSNAAYLILRGINTQHLHVQQQNSTALKIALSLYFFVALDCVYYSMLTVDISLSFWMKWDFIIELRLEHWVRWAQSTVVSFVMCEPLTSHQSGPWPLLHWVIALEYVWSWNMKDSEAMRGACIQFFVLRPTWRGPWLHV